MKKALLYATAAVFALSLGGGLTSSPAFAQTAAKGKMTLATCKKLADPKAKDDCIKQVNAQMKKDKAAKSTKTAKAVKKAAPKK